MPARRSRRDDAPGLDALLAAKEMLVVCGSGGTGKTTVAAALGAIAATELGGRVLVLTVDPARRLATALGLGQLGNTETRIDPELLRGPRGRGTSARGEVWGLDMTPDMIALARHNAGVVGSANVKFRLGEMEDIPFEDGKFDAIMSNCVINLSHDKSRVFSEAFRVLKSGGRLRVSDMVWVGAAPEATLEQMESWAHCVAGALTVDDYLDAIRGAGFTDVRADYEGEPGQVTSASVFAVKP